MKERLYGTAGMSLFRLPAGWRDPENKKRRNIGDLEATTAAQMLSAARIRPDFPTILCGRYNKTYPVLRQLTKMSDIPYVLMGTQRDMLDTCLADLPVDWTCASVGSHLPAGNGRLCLKPGAETSLLLKEVISDWGDHLLVVCLGNGLQVDGELLNLLNAHHGRYILVTEVLRRSVKGSEGYQLTVPVLLAAMDHILVSSIGTSAKDLMEVLPSYECEKITNTTDFSSHRDAPNAAMGGYHHRNGSGLRFSQARTVETKCIVTQDDLTRLQDTSTMLIYNARTAHTWVARIVR